VGTLPARATDTGKIGKNGSAQPWWEEPASDGGKGGKKGSRMLRYRELADKGGGLAGRELKTKRWTTRSEGEGVAQRGIAETHLKEGGVGERGWESNTDCAKTVHFGGGCRGDSEGWGVGGGKKKGLVEFIREEGRGQKCSGRGSWQCGKKNKKLDERGANSRRGEETGGGFERGTDLSARLLDCDDRGFTRKG